MPFDLDDIRHSENGIIEAIAEIAKAMGDVNPAFILHGCDFSFNTTTNEWDVNEGAIYANGEIYQVAAHTSPAMTGTGSFFWMPFEAIDVTGTETFENGASVDTYIDNQMVLTNTTVNTQSPNDPDAGIPKFNEIFVLKTQMDQLESDFNAIFDHVPLIGIVRRNVVSGQSYQNWTAFPFISTSVIGSAEMTATSTQLRIPPSATVRFTIHCPHQNAVGSDAIRINGLPAGTIYGDQVQQQMGAIIWQIGDDESFIYRNPNPTSYQIWFDSKLDANIAIVIEWMR